MRLVVAALAAPAVAIVAGCGGGSSQQAAAPLDPTPVIKTKDSGQAPDGARGVVLPPSGARREVEVPACGRQAANRFMVDGASQPRLLVVEPCSGDAAGSVVVGAPGRDAQGAAAPGGIVEAPGDLRGRTLVVPACRSGQPDTGPARVRPQLRGDTVQAPPCRVSNLPGDAALPLASGSRAVQLTAAASQRTVGVPPCGKTTGAAAVDPGTANDVTVTTGGDPRMLVVGPCPLQDGRLFDAAGSGVLVLAPRGGLPGSGPRPAGTLTVPASSRTARVEVPGCTLPNDGHALRGVGNLTLTRPSAPPCQVPGTGFSAVGGEPGGAGAGGEQGGGQGGNPPS
jgi:hypothetical protein